MRKSKAPSMLAVQQKKPRFTDVSQNSCSECENKPDVVVTNSALAKDGKRHFSVLWAKASTRKHKKWEGDGFVAVGNYSVELRDEHGKLLSSATGYKTAQLQELKSGSVLSVGSKEIEIQHPIVSSSFNSDIIVTGQVLESSPVTSRSFTPKMSSFKNPCLNPSLYPSSPVSKALLDPLAPGALVMPRPPSAFQVENRCTNIVDVVVDPYVSRHLRPHQREGVLFMYECVMGFKTAIPGYHGVILADEMGLGKTLQCITLIWTLLKQGPYGGKQEMRRGLVVCPTSLVKTWEQQFMKWLGKERITVFPVGKNNKVVDFAKSSLYSIMIISYEMFVRNFEEIEAISDIDLAVFDEAHRLKNADVKAATCAAQLMCERKVLLTGTPIQNDLKELYTLVSLANPGILGTHQNFRKLYEDPILASQQLGCCYDVQNRGECAASQLSHLLSLFTLRRTMEVNDAYLPPKTENIVFCPLTPKQEEMYRKLSNSALFSLLDGFTGSSDHLAFIAALRKLCNHPDLLKFEEECNEDEFETSEKVHKVLESVDEQIVVENGGKMQVLAAFLKQFLEGTKEKIVLVSHFTKMLDIFAQFCDTQNYPYLRLDGSTEASKRQSAVDRFNSHGTERIFLLSAKAGGLGLSLTGASHLILYDIDWNPAHDIQAMARIRRDGQKRHVQIYRFITTGTVEENIFQRQTVKQGLSGAVVDSRQLAKTTFSREELKDLMTLKDGLCDTHDMLFCTCDKRGKHPLRGQNEKAEDEAEDEDRPFQISATAAVTKKHKTMDQLLLWEHYEGPIELGMLEDQCLEAAGQFINFVFRSTSNGVMVKMNSANSK